MGKIWLKNNADGLVIERNDIPSDLIHGVNAERAKTGVFINSLPVEPAISVQQYNELHIDVQTKIPFWVTKDRSPTSGEEMQQMKSAQTLMQIAIDDLIMGGII